MGIARDANERLTMKKLAVGVAIASAIVFAPSANADYPFVCEYLDNHPYISGVEDLVGIAIVQENMTGSEAGEVILNIVVNNCPRHLLTLQQFARKWAS